jgi:glutathione S-transferase
MELFVEAKDFRLQRLQVAAQYAKVVLKVQQVPATHEVTKEASPQRLPVLRTGVAGRSLSGTNAILRHLAALRADAGRGGFTAFEESSVDQWLDWAAEELDPVVALITGHASPAMQSALKAGAGVDKKDVAAGAAYARGRLPQLLHVLERHLAARTFLASERLTVADVATSVTLAGVWDDAEALGDAKAGLPHVSRWYATCRFQRECVAVLGEPSLAGAASAAGAAASAAPASAVRSAPLASPAASGHAAFTSGAPTGAAAVAVVAADGGVSAVVPSALTAFPTALPDQRFRRFRQRVADVFLGGEALIGQSVTVCGWARTVREAGAGSLAFIALNDGSTFESLQVVADKGKTEGFAAIAGCGGTHASFRIQGTVVKSPAKGQAIELVASSVAVLGGVADPATYPLSKKKHTPEYLRDILHLRPRTNLIGAVARIRNACAYATHRFFQDRGFLYVHTPIITGADCEGAGEMFQVTTVLPADPTLEVPRVKAAAAADAAAGAGAAAGKGAGKASGATSGAAAAPAAPVAVAGKGSLPPIDYSRDFFGKPTMLTVSGQLQVRACTGGRLCAMQAAWRCICCKSGAAVSARFPCFEGVSPLSSLLCACVAE